MNDDDMLATMRSSLTGVKDSLTDVHLDRPPEAITARARARRLRRGLSGAGAAGLGLGLALTLTLGSPATARPVHVNLDAWSVNTTSPGTVEVTVREMDHPAELRQALAKAGVPALVLFGELCDSPTVVPGARQAIEGPRTGGNPEVEFRIHPAAIPAGAEILISIEKIRVNPPYHGTALVGLDGVIWKGSHLTCPPPVRSGGESLAG
jgi:hypothetical protein